MTTSVFIRNDSAVGNGHAICVGVRHIGHEKVLSSVATPLEPGQGVTTTVYLGMELVVSEAVGNA